MISRCLMHLYAAAMISLGLFSCSTTDKDFSNLGSAIAAAGCGNQVGEFEGVKVFSNGANTTTGDSCHGTDGDYGYLYQCKEFVTRYFAKRYGADWVPCHAHQCLDNFKKNNDYIVFDAGQRSPQPGDAVVFKGGEWGHIAIVTKVSGDKVTFINQNTHSLYGEISLPTSPESSYWGGMRAAGFIRAKAAGNRLSSNSGGPNTTQTAPVTSNVNQDTGFSDNTHVDAACDALGQHSNINTCGESFKSFKFAANTLVDCKQRRLLTCSKGCFQNVLGSDDYCNASDDDITGQGTGDNGDDGNEEDTIEASFTVLGNGIVALEESKDQGQVDAAWVAKDLQNLCSQTLVVGGESIDTCRSNFNPGFLGGRFDDAKESTSPTKNWLIDCGSASGAQPRWLYCRNGCFKAAYGEHDSCIQ